jgi:hypothetical protein
MELEVDQPAVSRLDDMGPPAAVDGGYTTVVEGDHVAGLRAECRPGDTWVECPR